MFKKIFNPIKAILIGHWTVFKHSFKKRVTLEYPEVKKKLNDRFRGKHIYSAEKCIHCGICAKVCPANAITVSKEDKTFIIDLKKCIFCGNCGYYCPKGAVKLSDNFELATSNKSDLELDFTPLSNIIEDEK